MTRTGIVSAPVPEGRITPSGSLIGNIFPQNYVEFSAHGNRVTWTINVRGANNAPTTWSLKARFLDVLESAYGPQYSQPELLPFTEMQTQNFIAEKVGFGKPSLAISSLPKSAGDWGVIADNTDNLGGGTMATVQRTVTTFNRRHKLAFQLDYTGTIVPEINVYTQFHIWSSNG